MLSNHQGSINNPLSPLPLSPGREFRGSNAPFLLSSVARDRNGADDFSPAPALSTSSAVSAVHHANFSAIPSMPAAPARRATIAPIIGAPVDKENAGAPSAAAAASKSGQQQHQDSEVEPNVASTLDEQQQQQQPNSSPTRFAARLRQYLLHYAPHRASEIPSLVERFVHKQPQFWALLEKKYGRFPTDRELDARQHNATLRAELVLYFRHYEPPLEAKVDLIMAAFADFSDTLWTSLEHKFGPRAQVPALNASASMAVGGAASEASLANFGDASATFASAADLEREGSGLAMDLGSRLRRFFEKHDRDKLPRVDEMAAAYRHRELDLYDSLRLLYDADLEPPPGGFKETDEQHAGGGGGARASRNDRQETGKKLQLSRGRLVGGTDTERFLAAFANKYAPEKAAELELIADRFRGKETQLREAVEAVLGPVNVQAVPRDLSLARERVAAQRKREEDARREPPEVTLKRTALQARLERFFTAHDAKMVSKCRGLAAKFLKHEPELMRRLVKKYGPEPASGARLDAYRVRLTRFYDKYNAALVPEVDEILARNAGYEDTLMQELVVKYGPEPPRNKHALNALRNFVYGKLSSYLKYFDPLMLPNIDKIFDAFAETGQERELIDALHRTYGLLPPRADITVQDPERYGMPADMDPATDPRLDPVAAIEEDAPRDEYGETAADRRARQPIPWSRTGVQGTDPAVVKRYCAEYEAAQAGKHVDPAKIRPEGDVRLRLLNYIGFYLPERVNDVDKIYAVFNGHMDDLLAVLRRRLGPEPRRGNAYSQAALDESQRILQALFSRYFQHYDPSRMYEVDSRVAEYVGRIDDARAFLEQTYGPEPRYTPLAADLRRRLIFYFRWWDPEQLANVDVLADAYVGQEEILFARLGETYGPEPKINFKATRAVFRERLQRYATQYPHGARDAILLHAAQLSGEDPAYMTLDTVVERFEDFQDEFMLALLPQFGPEPPDPEEEAKLRAAEAKRAEAQAVLRRQLNELFAVYEPQQLGDNVETLVDSYWEAPDELLTSLYQHYGVDHETVERDRTKRKDDDDNDGVPPPPPPAFQAHPDPNLWNRVTRMYLKYRRRDVKMLPIIAEKYTGREQELLDALVGRYGPEPDPNEDLSPPEEEEEDDGPKTLVRPTVPLSQHRPPGTDADRIPAAVRAERILQKYDRRALRDLPRMLKRYEGMLEDLVAVLEEKYELHPGTLVPVSQLLRPEDLLDDAELEQSRQRERERDEALRAKPVEYTPRDRALRLFQYYDPAGIVQMDVELKNNEEDVEAYLRSLVDKYGPEPAEADFAVRYKLLKWYQACDPSKIKSVDDVLERFHGRELMVLKMFTAKYGPLPPDPEPLPAPEFTRAGARRELVAIYTEHAPEKLAKVDELLDRYRGHEDDLIRQARARYAVALSEEEQIWRERFTAIYTKYAPEKLTQLPDLMWRYRDDYMNLLEQLQAKYGFARIPRLEDARREREIMDAEAAKAKAAAEEAAAAAAAAAAAGDASDPASPTTFGNASVAAPAAASPAVAPAPAADAGPAPDATAAAVPTAVAAADDDS